jgi:hypothetical protein
VWVSDIGNLLKSKSAEVCKAASRPSVALQNGPFRDLNNLAD